MAFEEINGNQYFVEKSGSGSETIVFAHGLLMNHKMFDKQVEKLSEKYTCLRFDWKGQGKSGVPRDGYDMESLSEDIYALIKKSVDGPVHYAGLSMGAMVGFRLAIDHPEILRSFIILNSSAGPEPDKNIPRYNMLNFIARWFGLKLVVNKVLPILFGATFMNDNDRKAEREFWKKQILAQDRLGITRAVRGVIDRKGMEEKIDQIKLPTLILAGDEDVATPLEKSVFMNENIPHSKLVVIEQCGHSSSIEQPESVTREIELFLSDI
jgi:pimeloyl-ACP methyl ester carboxylesterase